MDDIKIYFNPLRSKKQLKVIAGRNVVSAGYSDSTEKMFTIVFDVGGQYRRDLTIMFESRTPRIYLSDVYAEC